MNKQYPPKLPLCPKIYGVCPEQIIIIHQTPYGKEPRHKTFCASEPPFKCAKWNKKGK